MTRYRRAWIGTSWKMNKTRGEAVAYIAELCDWVRATELDVAVVIFPPFTALPAASAQLVSSLDAPIANSLARPRPSLQLGAKHALGGARGPDRRDLG